MASFVDLIQKMERFRNGDKAVFEEIYHEFKKPVYVLCRRIVWNDEDAKDMTSNTFLKLWMNRADVKDFDHLTPFIYSIARNTSIDFLRTQSRQIPRTPFIENHTDELFDNQSDPSWMMIDKERVAVLDRLAARIKQEIQEMPFEYGKILRYFTLGKKKPAAIANMLDISVYTVRKHLAVARDHLVKKIADQELPAGAQKKPAISYFISLLHRNNI